MVRMNQNIGGPWWARLIYQVGLPGALLAFIIWKVLGMAEVQVNHIFVVQADIAKSLAIMAASGIKEVEILEKISARLDDRQRDERGR